MSLGNPQRFVSALRNMPSFADKFSAGDFAFGTIVTHSTLGYIPGKSCLGYRDIFH
jgi:hypothetical protein